MMPEAAHGITPYHAAYFAHELTRRSGSDDIARLGTSLFNATVDLNPHQLDAALFAFRAPLSRGALLADEVGLGKTIEAGLVISQLWAERKRRVLVIAPAILRKQWAQELADKFFIGSQVVDTRQLNAARKAGQSALEPADRVVIASYHFVAGQQLTVHQVPWDLVVIDEAHRLRNVYKPTNRIASAIREVVRGRPLLLLTATPLQNDLLELFGLVSFLDEHVFGDVASFRVNYKQNRNLEELRERLRPLCQRTLRRQVQEYVRFTNRIPITQDFTPTPDEQSLYDRVSAYLQRDKLNALPSGQRQLMTLILRKLLASSTYAIAGTLEALAARLAAENPAPPEELLADFEPVEDLADEWEAENPPASAGGAAVSAALPQTTRATAGEVRAEIRELQEYGKLAASITTNAKGQALLQALGSGFAKMAELGAARKAVIFTESRRTQAYLLELLDRHGYVGKVMTINGTNADDRSGAIYRDWLGRHAGEEVVSGNKTVDLRAALVDHFRDRAEILLATEAAAEGVNLQFCSLVVNYDLPWNPQRIEQRIGRCHRYGQRHDVVVINFVNRANAADERVFELLSEKFQLFAGLFGSSDEVLGALESGVDFERRIAAIYQACRTTEEIDRAFAQLRADLEEQIESRLTDTRRALLEHFDEEVHQRLRVRFDDSKQFMNRLEDWLWRLTRYELDGLADFHEEDLSFDLKPLGPEWPETPPGRYQFLTRCRAAEGRDAHPYRPGHPLAEAVLARARSRPLPVARVKFDYSRHAGQIAQVRDLRGKSGWLSLVRLRVQSLEEEEKLLFVAHDGEVLHPEVCAKLFKVAGEVAGPAELPAEGAERLRQQRERLGALALAEIGERNKSYFEREIDKLDRWAEDLKEGLEREIKEVNAEIKRVDRESKLAPDLATKLERQREKKIFEGQRKNKQRDLFDAQDQIDARKELLISEVESRLKQQTETTELFTIAWTVE